MMPAGELWRSQQSVSCPYSPECVERLSGKCSEDALVTYAMLHGDHGEQEIPHRSVRRRMEAHQPEHTGQGRPRLHDSRAILDAVFYVLKSGCPWRLLPREFPSAGRPYTTGSGSGASKGPGSA